MNDPIDKWKGEFGDAYTERNIVTAELIEARMNMFMPLIKLMGHIPKSMLEVGAGNGQNLMALNNCFQALATSEPFSVSLNAVEPNDKARAHTQTECPYAKVLPNDIYSLPYQDSSMEFVFTSGVLIHIPPDRLEEAMASINRVSSRYIFCAEYFAPSCEEIKYRDNTGMLWRNDFGGLYMDKYKLRLIGYGFAWKRITKLDNLTWWLMEKTN